MLLSRMWKVRIPMKIILIRHGKPDVNTDKKLSADDMARWIEDYDYSKVSDNPPLVLSQDISATQSIVVASPLPRALTSLKRLGIEPDIIDPLFREAPLPLFNFRGLKLLPLTWAFWLRILWLAGYSGVVESRSLTHRRSVAAANQLIDLAEKNGTVLLMGHGIMNRMIGSRLKKERFRVTAETGKSYWRAVVYERFL